MRFIPTVTKLMKTLFTFLPVSVNIGKVVKVANRLAQYAFPPAGMGRCWNVLGSSMMFHGRSQGALSRGDS